MSLVTHRRTSVELHILFGSISVRMVLSSCITKSFLHIQYGYHPWTRRLALWSPVSLASSSLTTRRLTQQLAALRRFL